MKDLRDRIESLSPKRLALFALELQSKLEHAERGRNEAIAIIGIGCRFPGGAYGPDAYWDLLYRAVEAVGEVPSTRWDIDAYFDPDPDAAGRVATRRGGFLDQVDQFDAPFFGISRREAVSMDPQQRMLLEVSWEALEHAGHSPRRLAGSNTGVFVGLATGDYHSMVLGCGPDRIDAYTATGSSHSVAAGRIAYVLGLHGPNYAIDTACSSSLAAVHLASQSLRAGECRVALAGGVNAILTPDISIALSKSHMMAPDGRSKTFDASADGFVRGEGCGIVVLKRLSDALIDRDRILAVIRGSAVNQDGRSSGLTAPNGASQEAVIRQALSNAGVRPQDVSYVEAHGTGTSLGDPIEAHALASVLGPGRQADNPLIVGSVKTNLGHLESAAGVAGLIKVVLSLQHEYLPAHLHFKKWNPQIDWQGMPVEIPVSGRAWPRSERRRLAGVSSFGFGGTNAHLVVEEAPEPAARHEEADRPVHVCTLSARSPEALRRLAESYREQLSRDTGELGDICYTANVGRAHFAHRAAFVAGSCEDLRQQLAQPLENREPTSEARVAFLFTGQGSQYAGMGKELYQTQPVFRRTLDQCAELLKAHLKEPLTEVLWGAATHFLEQTAYTQPALFSVEYALAELWKSWGIEPAAVLGHSVGEYTAACVAGFYSLEEGLGLIAERGRRMQQLPGQGGMAAVEAGEAQVREVLRGFESSVSLAAVNGPQSVVISGDGSSFEQVCRKLEERGMGLRRLEVSHAFHSAQMDPMVDGFAELAAGIGWRNPRTLLISSVTGDAAGLVELSQASYWRKQVRQPVRFQQAMESLERRGLNTFLEIGPGTTLLGLGKQSVPGETPLWLPSLRRGHSEQIFESLGKLYVRGAEVDWAGFDAPYDRRPVSLPTYPFERQRYWIDPAPLRSAAARLSAEHPMLEAGLPAAIPIYEGSLDPSRHAFLREHRVGEAALLPASMFVELALAAAARTAGLENSALSEFEIKEPLRITESPARVQVVLTPGRAGEATVQIFSSHGEKSPVSSKASATRWTPHASGRLLTAGEPPRISLKGALERITKEIDPARLYEDFRARGINIGEGCRAIRSLRCGTNEALAEIALEPNQDPTNDVSRGYRFHPVLLDACFQTLGAALLFGGVSGSHVMTEIGAFRCFAPAEGRLTVHAVTRSTAEGDVSGDIFIFNASGDLVAEATALRMQPFLSATAPPEASGKAPDDWFYQLTWERKENSLDSDRLLTSLDFRGKLSSQALVLSRQEGFERYDLLHPQVESLAAQYIWRALEQMGLDLKPGVRVSVSSAVQQCAVIERQRALFERMFAILAEDGILRQIHGDGISDEWEVIGNRSSQSIPAVVDQLTAEFPEFATEIEVTRRCASALGAVLQGKVNPLVLLFPDGSTDGLEKLYTQTPSARVFNGLVRVAIELEINNRNGSLRALEIGAGTGGTTAYLLPALPADRVEYTFTDVSRLFLSAARQKFADHPSVRYALLDIEQDPARQGFAASQYDIIIAANVLHATADLRKTVDHAAGLLAPGGLLILVEGVKPERWVDLTFGMTEGWWRFRDRELRPQYPLLPRESWLDLLTNAGFDTPIGIAPSEGSQQVVFIARRPEKSATASENFLIVPDSRGIAQAAAKTLAAAGGRAHILTPEENLEERLRRADYDHIIQLAALNTPDSNALDVPSLATAASNIYDSLIGQIKSLVQSSRKSRLWLVTSGAQSIDGGGDVAVAQAPIWGIGRTCALEQSANWGGLIDLDPRAKPAEAAASLLKEVLSGDGDDQVAYRAGVRHVARITRSNRPTALPFAFRPDASYLITGGLGNLGLEVARWMVQRGARQLVLAGRHALPDRSWWESAPAGSREARQIAAVLELESLGANVRIAALDVSDSTQLSNLAARFKPGELRGVIHTAAAFDRTLLKDLSASALHDVLRPKVQGSWALHEWTRSLALDFFVLFSSTTSLLGSQTFGAYAAANQFMDALAHHRRAVGLPAISINWGTWEQMGDTPEEDRKAYLLGGIHPMSSAQALDGLDSALGGDESQTIVANIDWSVLKPLYEARRARLLLSHLSTVVPPARTVRPAEPADLITQLADASPEARERIVVDAVRSHAAAVLGVKPAEVSLNFGLFEMGMDSLMSVELKARLEKCTGRSLPSTLTFNYPNVGALSSYILRLLTESLPTVPENPPRQVQSTITSATKSPREEEEFSEDELAAKLAEALRTI